MKKQYLKTRPVCKVTFSLPKEAVADAEKVELLGDFNDWDTKNPIALDLRKDGSYGKILELPAGRSYEFRYLINGERWENDWSADMYVPSPYVGIQNSVVAIEVPVEKEAKPASKPKPAKKKKAPAKDKLTKIEGIGPKISKLLQADGIDTFAKLAKASQKKLKGILAEAGPRYKMHNPGSWPKQAKLAAAGDWDALQKLQDELSGGK
jgi:predicted flap endonuclease-1-like 5' DNA nuclease